MPHHVWHSCCLLFWLSPLLLRVWLAYGKLYLYFSGCSEMHVHGCACVCHTKGRGCSGLGDPFSSSSSDSTRILPRLAKGIYTTS